MKKEEIKCHVEKDLLLHSPQKALNGPKQRGKYCTGKLLFGQKSDSILKDTEKAHRKIHT